jgi:hypothetical protein
MKPRSAGHLHVGRHRESAFRHITMAPKYIIALGLLLDIIGVCLLTIALISGRKGRLNDLRESMVRTTKIWDTHLEEIEQRLKPAYTQDGYALLAEDATHSRETARTQGRCAMKPRSAGYVQRWASKVMHHFVRFHVLPSVPSRLPAVAPVSARRVVPSLRSRCVRRRLAFSAFAWRRAVLLWRQRFYPFRGRKLRRPLAATVTLRLSAVRCRSVALAVALVRRVSSSARRGRRIASADFHSTGVACGGGGFVSRRHRGSSALALARFLGAPRVQPRGPTRRSTPFPSVTGRCAIKPRSAGHLARSAQETRH